MTESVHGLVDHLFRREAGRMVATLARSFGPARLDLAEEVVQEALLSAMRRWPFHGLPDDPVAWLYRVARNLALDRLRRETRFREIEREIPRLLASDADRDEKTLFAAEITDDQLRLIFLCCHPGLPRDHRVALTLKTVMGFGVGEIAEAFLARRATIAQRLVRAQRTIRERGIPLRMPDPGELAERFDAVLEVLYLVFNEGYAAHAGEDLVRSDLCVDALRLTTQLTALATIDRPAAHALASLLCFQASRLPARVDSEGEMVLMPDQDRGLWDRTLIRRGFDHLGKASEGDRLTVYHLQAAIAAQHAGAASDDVTDWRTILGLYDQLLGMNPTPIVRLNHAVALSRVRGPREALLALEGLDDEPNMKEYYLLPATRGEFHRLLGEASEASDAYRRALSGPCSAPIRRFLEKRLAEALRSASA